MLKIQRNKEKKQLIEGFLKSEFRHRVFRDLATMDFDTIEEMDVFLDLRFEEYEQKCAELDDYFAEEESEEQNCDSCDS